MKPEDVSIGTRCAGMEAWDAAMKAAKRASSETPTWPEMMAIVFAAMFNEHAAEASKVSG